MTEETASTIYSCLKCEPGSYKEIRDGLPCVPCQQGKASNVAGANSSNTCRECDNTFAIEYTPEDVGLSLCKTIYCGKNEFLGETGCLPCDRLISALIILGSFAVIAFAGFLVEEAAQERPKMMQIKVLSTFFQCSELTTHVNIEWPTIAFWSLPFRIPFSSATCITPSWWNTRWNFLGFIYVPIVFFMLVFEKWRNLPLNSSEEKKLQQLGVFFAMLWYERRAIEGGGSLSEAREQS